MFLFLAFFLFSPLLYTTRLKKKKKKEAGFRYIERENNIKTPSLFLYSRLSRHWPSLFSGDQPQRGVGCDGGGNGGGLSPGELGR